MKTSLQAQVKAPSQPAFAPVQVGLLQRKCACGGSAGLGGQCDQCQTKKLIGLQTKLKVNEPGDIYEQEADRIAEQVMATPAHPAVSDAPPRIQRFAGPPIGQADTAPASVDQALASPGRPLEPALQQDMEQRFGHDFSRVRVHSGSDAEQSAREVNAHAYTVGHDMVFGAGRFAPVTHEGRRLLAHELTHVVQQSGADGIRVGQSNDTRGLSPIVPRGAQTRAVDRPTPRGGTGSESDPVSPSSARCLQSPIGKCAARLLVSTMLQRGPKKPEQITDPRATPGHPDPLIKVPATGPPVIEQVSEGVRSITWSWEVQRGTAAPGGETPTEYVYWATFEVNAEGVMTVSARMVSPSGQFRAPEWTLRSKFKEALEVFRLGGVEVRAFDAEWGYMGSGEISGNLDAFFGSLRANPAQRLDEAARTTPSGKVAIENGFTEVSVPDVGYDPNQEHLQATKERARQVRPVVRVRFAKPGTGQILEEPTGELPANVMGGQALKPRGSVTPFGGSTAGGGRSVGMRATAGGLGLLAVASVFIESIGQARAGQREQIALGWAAIDFWKRFGALRSSGIWDNWHQVALSADAEPSVSAVTAASFPYVVDIDVEAFKRNLPAQIHNYQEFELFLDLGKAIWAINEEPAMPAQPSAEERRRQREYWAPVAWPDRNLRHRYYITRIIAEVRDRTLGELDASMRAQLRGLPLAQQNNIFRLKSGSETSLFRSAKGGQRIVSSQRLLGPDPWVRPIGKHVEGGVGSWFFSRHGGSYRDRELVVPANADAERAALVSSYVIYKSLEDTLEEVRSGGRPILERTPPAGTLQSFVAGPEPGEGSRFGETRYYRHPDPDHNDWTVAIGELRQFWVNARELEPVTRTDVEAYAQRRGAAPPSP